MNQRWNAYHQGGGPLSEFALKAGGAMRHVKMVVDGKVLREFNIRLAEGDADWWAFTDLALLKGNMVALVVEGLPENSRR